MRPQHAARRAQVLIEMTMATVGVVVIAFVMARAANWLNESMVERNQSFQDTRMAAAQSAGLVGVAAPSDIHLIGPGAGRGGSAGPQGASSYNRSCPQGDSYYNQAMMYRQQADACMRQGEAERQQATDLTNSALILVAVANNLEQQRRDIQQCGVELLGLAQALNECEAAAAETWQNMDCFLAEQGIRVGAPSLGQTTGGNHVPNSLHYEGRARDYGDADSDVWAIYYALLPYAGPGGVVEELFWDPAGPGGSRDLGRPVNPIGGHSDHVHAALYEGATLPCAGGAGGGGGGSGSCTAEQNAVDNKTTECNMLVAARDTYCSNMAVQFGVSLTCDQPQTAIDAAEGKMSEVNGHIWQTRNMARCVYDYIGEAEDSERQAVRACARR